MLLQMKLLLDRVRLQLVIYYKNIEASSQGSVGLLVFSHISKKIQMEGCVSTVMMSPMEKEVLWSVLMTSNAEVR